MKEIEKKNLVERVFLKVNHIDKVLESKVDVILLMSVNPGFGGQSFIPAVMDKIRQVRQLIDQSGREIVLEIDGGVKVENIAEIAAAGVDAFVAGSAIFNHADYAATIQQMRSKLASK